MYTKQVKEKAKRLRKKGISYNQLQKMLSIPKSTLSVWFSPTLGMPFNRSQLLNHLRKIRVMAKKAKARKKLEDIQKFQAEAQKEIRNYPLSSKYFQKSLISMLYWAEGSKHEKVSGLTLVNTDPNLLELYILLLRKCFALDEKKFRVGLHLHYYHPIRETRKFWSELLRIPESQFRKTLIKKRSLKKKFRKNFRGICMLSYLDSSIRKEILALGYAMYSQYALNYRDKMPSSFNG
ncbi:MAG: hypothetical protein V1896_01755 [Candidatus Zambryskibacteria bacterium]